MNCYGIGNAASIDEFVDNKIKAFRQEEHSFEVLFRYMFSEKENILYERSRGYLMDKITYGKASEDISKIASVMSQKFCMIPKNSVIGFYMENRLEWIEFFWAILMAGYRPLLMNCSMAEETLESVLEEMEVKAVISSEKQFYTCETYLFSEFLNAESDFDQCEFGSEILFMSSGTSNHIKICAYGAEEIYHQIQDSYDIIRQCALMKKHYQGFLKHLVILPFYHVFGFIAVYLWFGFFSRTFVHLENLAPQTLLGTIQRHEVTHIFAVPLLWETIYDQAIRTIRQQGEDSYQRFQKGLEIYRKLADLPVIGRLFSQKAFRKIREQLFGESISFMITGGSEIRPEVLEFFNAIGYRLANGYGMTEIGITSVELGKQQKFLLAGSVGKPFSSVRYRINTEGELMVSGDSLARYIYENGHRQEREEWFLTRDLCQQLEGRFYIQGRKDDLVVTANGENLNPNIIEPLLGIPACLIRHDNKPLLLVSLQGYITKDAFLAIQKKLSEKIKKLGMTTLLGKPVYISDALMEENEFKKNRNRIAKDYQQGRFHVISLEDMDISREENKISKKVRSLIAAELQKKEEEIAYEADFFQDLAGSSLDYFALITALEEEFKIAIPIDQSSSLCTVKQLVEYIESQWNNVN